MKEDDIIQQLGTFSFPLSPGVSAEIKFRGRYIKERHFTQLIKHLELAQKAFSSKEEENEEGNEG